MAHGKPHPEVFLKGAEALGVDPAGCVVFEDAVYGIEAAIAGGMMAVALLTTHPRSHFDGTGPHLFVDNLAGLSLPDLRTLWK